MHSLCTVLADGDMQVVVALGVPAALSVPAQPCLNSATAEPGLQLTTALPCPALPSNGPTKLGPHPSSLLSHPQGGAQCPGLGVP